MPSQALIAERAERAGRHYRRCELCMHRCRVDRAGGQRGACGAAAETRVYRHRVEYGEELELVPSHVFYVSGCDLRCAFCIGGTEALDPRCGRPLTGPGLAGDLDWGRRGGARNLQWAGGEPTIHLPAILAAMAACPALPTVVWKSNFHAAPEALELLLGVADVFVADFKFGNDACARRIAGGEAYLATVTGNLLRIAGRADLIVRHLLLPGHFDCCYRPVVAWMRRHLPAAKFSIRAGYLPCWQARNCAELAAPLARGVGSRASALAREQGLNVVG